MIQTAICSKSPRRQIVTMIERDDSDSTGVKLPKTVCGYTSHRP
jgi:hypothetical protein